MLGVVYLDSQVAKGIFTAEDADLLTALSTHIAIAIQTAHAAQLELSVQAARREQALAEALGVAVMEMSESLEPTEVLPRLRAAAERMLPGDRAWALPSAAAPPTVVTGGAQLPLPAELTPRDADRLAGAAAGSWLCLPMLGDGQVIGAVVMTSSDPQAYGPAEVELAGTLAAQAMTAHDRARLFAQVQELATADELTGVANRRHFFDLAGRDLASARAHGHPLVAVMTDIDHFKRVNDTYGHPTGDDVIREVARRLSAVVRESDVVGRYGGEEFAVLLTQTRPEDIDATLERLRRAVAVTPIPTRSGPLTITISLGGAVLDPADDDAPALLARADAALYVAKQAGRDRACLAPPP